MNPYSSTEPNSSNDSNAQWCTYMKVMCVLGGIAAITAVVIGVLSILAAHGFPFRNFNQLGNIGGGALVSFGLVVPLLILGVACCRMRKPPQFGDRSSDGKVFMITSWEREGCWKTPIEVLTMDLGNDEFYANNVTPIGSKRGKETYLGSKRGWVDDAELERQLQDNIKKQRYSAFHYGLI